MIVSVPAAMETRIFSISRAMSARSFEVPMFVLIFVRRPLPMASAGIVRCRLLRMTTIVPSSTPLRIVSGSTFSSSAQSFISPERIPRLAISSCVKSPVLIAAPYNQAFYQHSGWRRRARFR